MEDRTKLDPEFLINAYASGFFPMPHPETEAIMWFDPDPRCIFEFEEFHLSKSLKKRLRKTDYRITHDKAFSDVMRACADRADTWINDEFIRAYSILNRAGFAHSLEVWIDGKLVGGIYGVAIGRIFCAESKFHTATDCSKIALYYLIEHLQQKNFLCLEVQFMNEHLRSLGAKEIPAAKYHALLAESLHSPSQF